MQPTLVSVAWHLAWINLELDWEIPGKSINDFILGAFDDEYLSELPPESDWSDWFPPPARLTEWELDDLSDWVEIEAEKHDLISDPDFYPKTG